MIDLISSLDHSFPHDSYAMLWFHWILLLIALLLMAGMTGSIIAHSLTSLSSTENDEDRLSEPVTAKETTSCANDRLMIGSSSMQGWRINMEDAHTHILSLAPEDPEAAFFAVYDGHGGAKVAHYAGDHLHQAILSQKEYKDGDIAEAMRKGFLQIDEDMLNDVDMKEELAGSTAIAILVKNGRIYIGNVGDSRAVASFHGVPDPLSIDHKPSNDSEAKRINAAGGWVEFNRVNGNLALSRALGDFVFKRNEKKGPEEQIVTAQPDIQSRDVTDDLEFIVIACDGIWDVLSNEEVIEFVRKRIAIKMQPSVICEELMTRCLAPGCQMGGLGCDNMTVILICFVNGKPYEELAAKCKLPPARVNSNGTNSSSSRSSSSCSRHNDSDASMDEEPFPPNADSPDSRSSSSSSSSPSVPESNPLDNHSNGTSADSSSEDKRMPDQGRDSSGQSHSP